MFQPYICAECGGSYQRCANKNNSPNYLFKHTDSEECKGGPYCWENKIIVEVYPFDQKKDAQYKNNYAPLTSKQIIKGEYYGRGRVELKTGLLELVLCSNVEETSWENSSEAITDIYFYVNGALQKTLQFTGLKVRAIIHCASCWIKSNRQLSNGSLN